MGMDATAKAMVWASLPTDLGETERRTAFWGLRPVGGMREDIPAMGRARQGDLTPASADEAPSEHGRNGRAGKGPAFHQGGSPRYFFLFASAASCLSASTQSLVESPGHPILCRRSEMK